MKDAVGVVLRDPGFKLGQEIRESLKQGKSLLMTLSLGDSKTWWFADRGDVKQITGYKRKGYWWYPEDNDFLYEGTDLFENEADALVEAQNQVRLEIANRLQILRRLDERLKRL